MEILGPKGPERYGGAEKLTWARDQLRIAGEIVDNPGGGLLFATQTIGQVKAALAEDGERWEDVVNVLERVEDSAVHRDFTRVRELLAEVGSKLE